MITLNMLDNLTLRDAKQCIVNPLTTLCTLFTYIFIINLFSFQLFYMSKILYHPCVATIRTNGMVTTLDLF